MSKEYVLETIADFEKIPDEKLEKCLDEFAASMLAARRTARAIEEMGRVMGTTVGTKMRPAVTWKDDDEKKLTVNIHIAEPKESPRGE